MRLAFAILLLACTCAAAQSAAPAAKPAPAALPDVPAYKSNLKYTAAMAEAVAFTKQHRYSFAVDSLKKANKIAAGQSWATLEQLYALQSGMGEYKDSAATAAQLLALAHTPQEKSLAETRSGEALIKEAGEKPKPAQMDAAHTLLQAAMTDYPANNYARYTDACLLARMGNMAESSKEFTVCAANAGPSDVMRLRARHFAEDPALSLHKMAPAFEVTANDGTKFNLDNMDGRVVLVDFWATWCGPCNEELPNVKKMAKEFANEPFTIISISWDADETKWKDFIAKHEMTWLQYRDADHKLSERFAVNAIPHYFTIDSDGVLTAEVLGSGNDVEGRIRKLLKKAHESHPAAASPTVAGTK